MSRIRGSVALLAALVATSVPPGRGAELELEPPPEPPPPKPPTVVEWEPLTVDRMLSNLRGAPRAADPEKKRRRKAQRAARKANRRSR